MELTNEQSHAIDCVLEEVGAERLRQHEKWGEQNHPDGTGGLHSRTTANIARGSCDTAFKNKRGTWRHILLEEYAEGMAESDPKKLRAELVQVAAVAVAWIEAIDRRKGEPVREVEGIVDTTDSAE